MYVIFQSYSDRIPVRALNLNKLRMSTNISNLHTVADSIPNNGIDFGCCTICMDATRSFHLANPTTVAVKYEIKNEQGLFEISPTSGVLQPRQRHEVIIKFNTSEAKVVSNSVVFKLQEGSQELHKVLKISAIGKYPFLMLDQNRIDFGSLLVGKTEQRQITLTNSSQVPTSFVIEKDHDDGRDHSLSVSSSKGSIAPGQSYKITVKYVPSIVDEVSCAYYTIKTMGGNQLKFHLRGQAEGYNVHLSTRTVHFGEVQTKQTTNRLLNIHNESDLPISFQFMTEKCNVFAFSQLVGVVKPKSSARIIITFTPQSTQNYYERVYCVVRNHKILYVDLLGTCFDILTKPIPLMQKDVDNYRQRVIMGTHTNSAPKVNDKDSSIYNTTNSMTAHDEKEGMELTIPDSIRQQDLSCNQVVLHKEMLLDFTSEKRQLRFNQEFMDFNFTESGRLSEGKQLTMENKFPFDVQVNWTLLPVLTKTTKQWVKNPFRVLPESTTIKSNSSFNFNVEFAPYEPDSYFFQIAQCFVQLLNGNENKTKKLSAAPVDQTLKNATQKSSNSNKDEIQTQNKTLLGSMKNRKYEDFSHEAIDPPSCMNVRLVGHSFPPGSQPFIPMIKIPQGKKVAFQPCGPGESVYQTVQIQNTSDTPVFFKVLQDTTKTFKAFPQIGLIAGKSFTLICLEFSPKQARFFNFNAQCIFNNSPNNVHNIQLIGHCYAPSISFPRSQQLFFPPAFSGVSSRQNLHVKNDSRIALEYEWAVPEKYRNEITFEPSRACMQPNEDVSVAVTFTPLKKKEYRIIVPIYTKNISSHIKNQVGYFNPGSGQMLLGNNANPNQGIINIRKEIEIIGAGSDGSVIIKPDDLDFGTITVGFSKTLSVVIANKSNCNLYIKLQMALKKGAQEMPDSQKILQECFHFDNHKGLINARSKKKVNITFKPTLRFEFDINLVCIAKEKMTNDLKNTLKETNNNRGEVMVQKSHIQIHAKGDYPLLRFTDVRNDQVSIASLWEKFHLTTLNKELLTPLNESEITFNNSDRTNSSMQDLQKDLKEFVWDFGKVPIKFGPKPRRITLTLKNVGGVKADWNFKMPNDHEIELEPWADPGEPSEEQAFEQKILDNNIFHIEPRRGSLEPGEQMDLSVLYYPKDVSKHHLKLFFQILNGKPLIIKFSGETLNRRAQLQLLKNEYHFTPIPIGLEWPVTFPIEIKNLGITKLKYNIDCQALEQLNSKNYDFRVFEIQNPEDTLLAGQTKYIYTLFRPLEATEYSLDLPIKISDIEGASNEPYMLKLRGVGYHYADKIPTELQFYEDLPKCRAHLNDNGSLAAFSTEEIDFGELETGEHSNRFVILYNLNPTQKLKFDFTKSGLMCGDNLRLEPMQGELKPNSHFNIKMTLVPARIPTFFQGEIQCQIEWESNDDRKEEARSVHTNTAVNDQTEFLFLRLKKKSKITKTMLTMYPREGESMLENILNEAMNDILESDELEKLLDDCDQSKVGLYQPNINNEGPPAESSEPIQIDTSTLTNKPSKCYQDELLEVSGYENEEMFRKRMFLQEPFVELMEFMLEDTVFNLIEEATFEEFDLTQAPRIYIRRDQQPN